MKYLISMIFAFVCTPQNHIFSQNIIKPDSVYIKEFEYFKNVVIYDETDLNNFVIDVKEFKSTSQLENFRPDGIVTFKILINENGKVERTLLLNGQNPSLNKMVKSLIKKSIFKPLKDKNNKPFKYCVIATYRFRDGKILSPLINGIPLDNVSLGKKKKKFEFFAVTKRPVLIQKCEPYLPDNLSLKQKELVVIVTITINEYGQIEYAKIFKPVNLILNHSALDASFRYLYTPAKDRGKPVKVKINIPITFKLKSRS